MPTISPSQHMLAAETSIKGTSDVIIRLAAPSDAATIKRFNLALLRETGRMGAYQADQVLAGVDETIRRPEEMGRYYIAEVEKHPVGQTKLRRENHDFKGEIWWLEHIYVVPSFRGRRVFSALFRYAEQLAEQQRVEMLLLRVVFNNERAIRAYRRLGMAATMLVMEKPLCGTHPRNFPQPIVAQEKPRRA